MPKMQKKFYLIFLYLSMILCFFCAKFLCEISKKHSQKHKKQALAYQNSATELQPKAARNFVKLRLLFHFIHHFTAKSALKKKKLRKFVAFCAKCVQCPSCSRRGGLHIFFQKFFRVFSTFNWSSFCNFGELFKNIHSAVFHDRITQIHLKKY